MHQRIFKGRKREGDRRGEEGEREKCLPKMQAGKHGGVGGNEEFYGRKHTLLKGVVYCMAKIQS